MCDMLGIKKHIGSGVTLVVVVRLVKNVFVAVVLVPVIFLALLKGDQSVPVIAGRRPAQ